MPLTIDSRDYNRAESDIKRFTATAAELEAAYNEKEVAPRDDSQLAILESQLTALDELIQRAHAELVGPYPSVTDEREQPEGITNRLAAMSQQIAAAIETMSVVCQLLRKIERGS